MKTLSILAAVLILSGCTTLGDARLAKGTGMMRSYDASFEKTWAATLCSVNGLGLPVAGDNKQEGYILAQRGMTAFSYGENIAIFIHKRGPKGTDVEVVSKKAMQTNIFAPDWAPKILNGIDGCLVK